MLAGLVFAVLALALAVMKQDELAQGTVGGEDETRSTGSSSAGGVAVTRQEAGAPPEDPPPPSPPATGTQDLGDIENAPAQVGPHAAAIRLGRLFRARPRGNVRWWTFFGLLSLIVWTFFVLFQTDNFLHEKVYTPSFVYCPSCVR